MSGNRGSGRRQRNPTRTLGVRPCDYQAPGPGRDLMHANRAIHDVNCGLLRSSDARKIKEPGGTVYLGVR